MKKILVFGDAILDRYLIGESKGLSPEGAFPLVLMKDGHEDYRLGGAANCANCIKQLVPEAQVDLMSIIGTDFAGVKLRQMLGAANIGFEDTMFYTDKHPTILKTRVCIGSKQVVRYDIEDKNNMDSKQLPAIIDKITKIAKNYDVLVVSDYDKGVVNSITFACLSVNSNGFVVVDPKKNNFRVYSKADLITPNLKEFAIAINRDQDDEYDMVKESRKLMLTHGIGGILITMSEKGMMHIGKEVHTYHPTKAKSVVDVVGAGDTVVATIAAMKVSGHKIKECVRIANIAAGLIISKFGTSTITKEELEENL